MTKVLDWKQAEDPRDVVHLSVQALAEGHLVAFPSRSGYLVAACSLRPAAVENLRSVHEESLTANPSSHRSGKIDGSSRPAIVVRSAEELRDYVPEISPVASRLARRFWPGSLVLRLRSKSPSALMTQLPQAVRNLVIDDQGYCSFIMTEHPSTTEVLRLTSGPLMVMRPKDSADDPQRADQVDGRIALAIDDGPVHAPAKWASIRIEESRCEVENPGSRSIEDWISDSQFKVLLVCTGNTCRSPMAEQLLRRKLKDRFPDHFANSQLSPIEVASAGISAYPGGPASDGAIAAMAEMGLDLTHHESQPTTQPLVDRADLILTMTNNHRLALLGRWPYLASKTFGLATDRGDVGDPYGGPAEVYQACAKKMDTFLEAWLEKLDRDTLPIWSVTGAS
jgi:protein-tyrosine phosphatase